MATSGGDLIGFHAGQLVVFDPEGDPRRVMNLGLTEGHGITLVREDDKEYLWVSDPGFVFEISVDDGDETLAAMFGKGVRRRSVRPRVVKATLGGGPPSRATPPAGRLPHPARAHGRLLPDRHRHRRDPPGRKR